MSKILPREAEALVDPTSTLRSIERLTQAVNDGRLSLATLVDFVKLAGAGETPRFSRLSKLPEAMLQAIRANPDTPPRQIVYKGVASGLWSFEDAELYEANALLLSERSKRIAAPRRVAYLTRRSKPDRSYRHDGMFVPKTSLSVFTSKLCDGAKACLAVILTLAGKEKRLVTYTSSIATMMGRTARTVRNYFIQLEEAGLITRKAGKLYNTVEINVSSDCDAPAYKENVEERALKTVKVSQHPYASVLIANLVEAAERLRPAEPITKDRRKGFSAFNLLLNQKLEEGLQMLPQKRSLVYHKSPSHVCHTSHSKLLAPEHIPFGNRCKFGVAKELF